MPVKYRATPRARHSSIVSSSRIDPPDWLRIAVRYRPARESLTVGGDFYDAFACAGEFVLVVGDVCGKGPEAAALTAVARNTLRATVADGIDS